MVISFQRFSEVLNVIFFTVIWYISLGDIPTMGETNQEHEEIGINVRST